jgi:hypothetical protein
MQYSISYYVYLLLTYYKAKQIHNFVLLLQCRTPTDRGLALPFGAAVAATNNIISHMAKPFLHFK